VAGNGYQSGWGGDRRYAGDQGGRRYAGDQAGHTLPDRGGYGGYDGGQGEPYYYGAGADQETWHDRGYPQQDGYQQDGYGQDYGQGQGQDYRQGGGEPYPYEYDEPTAQQDHVATYRAGGRTAPRTGGPRLPWRELLVGIYRAPTRTFDQMRDHQAWLPAVVVSLLYGALAVFGFGDTRHEVVGSTFTVAAWALLAAAAGFALTGVILGSVTYALSRQFGGDGPYASTVGLSVLIGWTSDAPRLLLALFLPSTSPLVQALGWISWAFCAVLLTSMVRRLHDLPWGKAAGAAAVQLLVLLVLIKLPTLG
jgi:hypothetical protein